MSKGQVVCEAVSATPPSGNLIEVALADNNGTNTMPALGILNEDLDAAGGANDEGDAIMFGKVSGIDTSAFSVGDEVFVDDTPGGLTTTKPTGVKYIQKVGVVIRDDATNGTIEVFGAGRVNDVPTPLYVDHANQRLGIGAESPATKLDVYGTSDTYLTIRNSGGSNAGIRISGGSAGISHIWHDETETNPPGIHVGTSANTATAPTTQLYIKGSNGNVGIGTTSPGHKLSVIGGHIQTDGNVYTNVIRDNTGGNVSIQDNGGNVGIGTTSPSSKLEVNGTAAASSFPSTNFSAGVQGFAIESGDSAITTYRFDANRFRFYSGNYGEIVSIQENGNVGIGTTSPSQILHLEASGTNPYLRVTETGNTGIDFGQATNGNGVINLRDSAALRIFTSATERMRINSSGDVGIGTTSPSYKLDVNGVGRFSEYLRVDTTFDEAFVLNSTDDGAIYMAYKRNGDRHAYVGFGGSNDQFYITNEETTGSLYFNTVGGGIYVNSNGNVGIGTTSPDTKLHVEGNLLVDAYNQGEDNGIFLREGFLTIDQPSITVWDMSNSGASPDGLSLNAQDGIRFRENGGEVARFKDGNFGIGTASPNATLKVQGPSDTATISTSSTPAARINNGGAISLWIGSNHYNYGYVQSIQDDGSNIFKRLSLQPLGGDVGIGTTSPSQKLDVNGNIISTSGSGNFIRSKHSASAYAQLESNSSGGIVKGIGGNGFLIRSYGDSFFNGGNVGIGITSPGEKLEVAGNAILDKKTILRLPYFNMGASSITDEYLVIARKYDGTNAQNATGIIGKIIFSRGATSAGNNPSEYNINIQCAYTTNGLNKLSYTGTQIFTSLDVIDISGTEYYALKVRTSGGSQSSDRMYAEGLLLTDGDSNIFTKVRSSDSAVTVVSTGAMTPDNLNQGQLDSRYVNVTGDTMSGNLTMNNSQIQITDSGAQARMSINNTGTGDPQINFQLSASSKFTIGVDNSDSDKFKISGSSALGSNDRIVVDSSGNVGIGTTSPTAKLDVAGAIKGGGKVTYTKSYGSLDTTGQAVAGLTAGNNGNSAGFIFTCFGGDGYQKIVYSCKNAAGTWDCDKDIDEGTNSFDVVASANSTTITFTVKARSATQWYSPRGTVEAFGVSINTTYF